MPLPFPNAATRPKAPSDRLIHTLMALLCLIWGSTYLVIRQGLGDLPPFKAAGYRFFCAFLMFSVLAPLLSKREGGEAPRGGLVLGMGLLTTAIPYGIVYWSETILPSGLVSVLWATFPILMGIAGHFFLEGERLVPRQMLGFLIGFAGVVVLFSTDLRNLGPGAIGAGAILLLSPTVYAIGTVFIKKRAAHTSSLLLNQRGMLVASVVLLGLGYGTEGDQQVTWSPTAIGSVLYLSIVGTAVTFSLYYWLLRYAPTYKLSLIAYIIPVIALTLGAVLADEPVGVETLLGTGLILLGVSLVSLRLGRRADAPAGEARGQG